MAIEKKAENWCREPRPGCPPSVKFSLIWFLPFTLHFFWVFLVFGRQNQPTLLGWFWEDWWRLAYRLVSIPIPGDTLPIKQPKSTKKLNFLVDFLGTFWGRLWVSRPDWSSRSAGEVLDRLHCHSPSSRGLGLWDQRRNCENLAYGIKAQKMAIWGRKQSSGRARRFSKSPCLARASSLRTGLWILPP